MLPITLIGAGNVAWQLGKALYKKGYPIIEVYSRTPENAQLLSDELHAKPIIAIDLLSQHQGIFICCVSDNAIASVAKQLEFKPNLLVHTSGSQPIDVLMPFSIQAGVLYPLQSLLRHRDANWSSIPICIEVSNAESLHQIQMIASHLSNRVEHINSTQRRQLHLAAVLVSNFTNYLYTRAEVYCKEHQLPFSILHPLILETAERLTENSPLLWQTGPARRNDTITIDMHKQMLQNDPELQQLYQVFSESIHNFFSKP